MSRSGVVGLCPRRSWAPALLAAVVVGAMSAFAIPARANDQMFPAQRDAASRIGWNGNYFVVNGEPTFLSAGEMQYARIPRALWREHLIRAKRAGLNMIQSYVLWNAQEPQPGVFDLTDNLDLDAWLTAVEDAGLYALIRLGPYSCAEGPSGGVPQWLTAQPNMQIRNCYAPWLEAVDAEFEQIAPILVKHQIQNGGGLILVQLENEDPDGWGTQDTGCGYLTHLYHKARSLGLDVPLFFSGMNHSFDPAGTTPFGDRTYPWYSTQFWTGWYTDVGELSASSLLTVRRGAWKVVAFGGGGASHYMFHGGTNFGSSGDTNVTPYDYGAPDGEEGQFRQVYYAVRQAHLFERAFEPLLATSKDGSALVSRLSNGISAHVRNAGSAGIAVFLDNPGSSAIQTQVSLNAPQITFPAGSTTITVAPNEIRPVEVGLPWTANASLAYLATNILGKLTLGTNTYYVAYGRPEESGEVAIQYKNAPVTEPSSPWRWDGGTKVARATFTYPSDNAILEVPIDSGDGSTITFLVVNVATSDLTWFTDEAIFIGATYVNDDLSIEVPPSGAQVAVYSSDGKTTLSEPAASVPTVPKLANWQWRMAAAEAQTDTQPLARVSHWPDLIAGRWSGGPSSPQPSFWMTTFPQPVPEGMFATVGLSTAGMSSGSVWVNGRDLGRFTGETVLYVPECWLTAANTVVVYDASGHSPAGIHLQYFETRPRYPSSIGTSPEAETLTDTSGSGGRSAAAGTGRTSGYSCEVRGLACSAGRRDVSLLLGLCATLAFRRRRAA